MSQETETVSGPQKHGEKGNGESEKMTNPLSKPFMPNVFFRRYKQFRWYGNQLLSQDLIKPVYLQEREA